MLASITTFAIEGVGSREVTVEVDVRRGLPTFTLVGLADRAIRESRERVRAALLNSGLEFPMKRLTVNLAPAHLRKAGPASTSGSQSACWRRASRSRPNRSRAAPSVASCP